MATACEQQDKRSGSLDSLSRSYFVKNASDEEDALNTALAQSPLEIGSYVRTGASYQEVNQDGSYEVAVTWSISAASTGALEVGTTEYGFSYQSPSQQIFYSLDTPFYGGYDPNAAGPPPGQMPFNEVPTFENALNVKVNDGKMTVDGIQLSPPPETFSISYAADGGTITNAYQRAVEKVVGHMNDATFGGRPIGDLLLTRVAGGIRRNLLASSTDSSPSWNIEFGFSFSPSVVNPEVGNIILSATKRGHEYIWAFFQETIRTYNSKKYQVMVPKYAYLEQIYPYANFSTLGLPGF